MTTNETKEKELTKEMQLTEFNFKNTDNVLEDVCSIIDSARDYAYQTVNIALIKRNWLIGYRIAKEELKGKERANYGKEIIKELAKKLTEKYGKGFTKTNLYSFYNFYKLYSNIFHTACGKSSIILSWSHYRILLQVEDKKARDWYENEAYKETWSVRTLQRNIYSQYYYRLLNANLKDLKADKDTEEDSYTKRLEFIKNPVIADF